MIVAILSGKVNFNVKYITSKKRIITTNRRRNKISPIVSVCALKISVVLCFILK